MVLLESNVEDVQCLLMRWLHSGARANDLEHLMRETFRVRVCERVVPGFLTTVEFMRRKVAWNVEDFFWIYDPTHTLASADEFGFVGKKQLDQTKSILCGTWFENDEQRFYMTVETSRTNEKHNSASL